MFLEFIPTGAEFRTSHHERQTFLRVVHRGADPGNRRRIRYDAIEARRGAAFAKIGTAIIFVFRGSSRRRQQQLGGGVDFRFRAALRRRTAPRAAPRDVPGNRSGLRRARRGVWDNSTDGDGDTIGRRLLALRLHGSHRNHQRHFASNDP